MLPQNRVHLLVGVEQKDTSKKRVEEGGICYLLQLRRTLEIFPKAGCPQAAKLGVFKLRDLGS